MSLKDRIAGLIEAGGPLPISAYMTSCLHDPEFGYYATRPGVGEDFTTAPETSQIFGELLGLWAVNEWRAMGGPDPFALVELGPGRGAMMADALRAARAAWAFTDAAQLTLVEASPALKVLQARKLAAWSPQHVGAIEAIPPGPAIILANEFLDCLPARQFVRDRGQWRERVVGLAPYGALAFGLAADAAPEIPATPGAAVEVQPGLEPLVRTLAARARRAPTRALFIDYGPADRAPGDTLRAYRNGEQVDPLTAPGECDLTVDVDFGRLRRLAAAAGLAVAGPAPQGRFLASLGVQARLDNLVMARPDAAPRLYDGARRLVDPAEMGERFKAICLSSPDLPPPAGF